MHLILSVDALSPPLSGIGRYTWELATRLPLCADVNNVGFYHQGRWIKNPSDLLDPAKNPLRRTWLQRQEPVWLRNLRLTRQCRGKLFHGPNYFLPPCADIGIATIHDLSVFRYPETHPLERIKQFEVQFQSTLKRADHLLTDSEAIRREAIATFSWPAERITTVHLGVSDCFKPLQQEETRPVLERYDLAHGGYSLCVSTIEPRKKIDTLLVAYSRLPINLRRRYPLVLVGGAGWKSDDLHLRIERCCAEGWLLYHGFVPEIDLPVLYAGARLFVYPSIYEGFGLPVLEAMASGVPVITSNSSSLPEVTGGAALLIEPDDEDALLQAVRMGLEDEAWRGAATLAGLQIASRFTWERCIERTLAVYGKVIGC